MKQLMSAFALAALLVAGLAVLQPAANAQTYATSLVLDNTETQSDALDGKQVVNVRVAPVNNCQPRQPVNQNGVFALQPTGAVAASNDVQVLPLDSNCNWNITYSDAAGACPVGADLIAENGDATTVAAVAGIYVNVNPNSGVLSSNGHRFCAHPFRY